MNGIKKEREYPVLSDLDSNAGTEEQKAAMLVNTFANIQRVLFKRACAFSEPEINNVAYRN